MNMFVPTRDAGSITHLVEPEKQAKTQLDRQVEGGGGQVGKAGVAQCILPT